MQHAVHCAVNCNVNSLFFRCLWKRRERRKEWLIWSWCSHQPSLSSAYMSSSVISQELNATLFLLCLRLLTFCIDFLQPFHFGHSCNKYVLFPFFFHFFCLFLWQFNRPLKLVAGFTGTILLHTLTWKDCVLLGNIQCIFNHDTYSTKDGSLAVKKRDKWQHVRQVKCLIFQKGCVVSWSLYAPQHKYNAVL